ncbi:putative PTS IIA-like nitrogen-regulatory protein PtsN [Desulfarculus baarsii DSM 2075]|uniref:PTS IIA-like nitrogen-regulatory protein PtsN n=1 Tax=Desulfarculus baarsii (strain ATCC 33931 / DSM 2075 / LMG 7858 / VKM B-1802 / 2st14) TaxID=644282 RepID=E1QL63_DESB2|nr:PTS sugar transporter subunit IIA [Desulfarculus baarsii]ADK85328.1 putative PTS IIA-like nitrogen-regulatory protein PtsN [Desulfarculus baarsii DSM 2075]
MKLTDILSKDHIIADLRSRTKRGVMEELCQSLASTHPDLEPGRLMEVLIERERLGSTGIGDGIAIPHGKTDKVGELMLAFGRSLAGVDFDSLDAKPAHLFFLVVAPENSAGVHLKALARISRLLKSTAVRRELLEAADAIEIYEIVAAQDEEF